MNVAVDGCDAEGPLALLTGETLVPVPALGGAGKLGAIAEVETVTVKADEDEEISAVVAVDDVMVDAVVADEVG